MEDDPYINVSIYNWEPFETLESPTTALMNSSICDSISVDLGSLTCCCNFPFRDTGGKMPQISKQVTNFISESSSHGLPGMNSFHPLTQKKKNPSLRTYMGFCRDLPSIATGCARTTHQRQME